MRKPTRYLYGTLDCLTGLFGFDRLQELATTLALWPPDFRGSRWLLHRRARGHQRWGQQGTEPVTLFEGWLVHEV